MFKVFAFINDFCVTVSRLFILMICIAAFKNSCSPRDKLTFKQINNLHVLRKLDYINVGLNRLLRTLIANKKKNPAKTDSNKYWDFTVIPCAFL